MKSQKQSTKLFLIVLAILSFWLFDNAAINQHSHLMGNGTVITHAHPFKASTNDNSPYQNHKHSAFSLIVLENISNVISLLAIAFSFVFFLNLIRGTIKVKEAHLFFIDASNLLPQRAPPAIA